MYRDHVQLGEVGLAGLTPSLSCPVPRVYEYQRIRMPPLINHMPVKIQRAHMGMGVRSGFSPQWVSRNSPLPSGQKKCEWGPQSHLQC